MDGMILRPLALVLPSKTTTQRDAMPNVEAGTIIYNSTTQKVNYWNGSAWAVITSS